MKRNYRLTEDDLIEKNHFPVKLVFNMVSDTRFIEVIKGISEGKGFGENFGACTFPGDLDEYDIATGGSFEGVEFGLHSGEEIIINYEALYTYLKKICTLYAEDYPDKQDIISDLLNRYKNKYKVN